MGSPHRVYDPKQSSRVTKVQSTGASLAHRSRPFPASGRTTGISRWLSDTANPVNELPPSTHRQHSRMSELSPRPSDVSDQTDSTPDRQVPEFDTPEFNALLGFVSSRAETATLGQYLRLRDNVPVPASALRPWGTDESFHLSDPGFGMDLAMTLQNGAQNESRTAEEKERMTNIVGVAHEVGIMLPRCSTKDDADFSIYHMITPAQTGARDHIVGHHMEHPLTHNPNTRSQFMTLEDKHNLSESMCTILLGRDPNNPRLQAYRNYLHRTRAAHNAAARTGTSWSRGQWNPSVRVSEEDDPIDLIGEHGVYDSLCERSHNMVCVAPLRGSEDTHVETE